MEFIIIYVIGFAITYNIAGIVIDHPRGLDVYISIFWPIAGIIALLVVISKVLGWVVKTAWKLIKGVFR